jgi:hypothetical protein
MSTPLTVDDFKSRLKLFIEKAELVLDRSFIKNIQRPDAGYSILFKDGVDVERRYPDDEAVEATSLTFRYFVQPRDKISFDQMANYYADPAIPLSQEVRGDFRKHYDELRAFEAQQSSIQGYTNETLRDTVMYGGIAHHNADKAEIVDRWKKGPLIEVAFGDFVKIMAATIQKVRAVAEVNRKALAELP